MILDASTALVMTHSALRWAALILLVWILVLAVRGMRGNLPYTKSQHMPVSYTHLTLPTTPYV